MDIIQEEKQKHFADQISDCVLQQVGGIENIKDIEQDCGTIKIALKDGSKYFISLEICELGEHDHY